VLVTAGSAHKLERCRELGTDAGINHREEDFPARVRELTGGHGADLVLDVMGASYLARNLDALAVEGRLVIIGLQGGATAEIDLNQMLRRRLTVIATTLRGRPLEQKAEIVGRFVEEALPGFDDGALRPVVDRVLPLAEAAAAHRAMEAGENVGKIVLAVD
jgi:NADPH:quinone reductase-like Zn-dependent oxidoreductase